MNPSLISVFFNSMLDVCWMVLPPETITALQYN